MSGVENGIAGTHSDALGARIGMWLFLFTEILLFGGLFLLYAVYRSKFPEDFHYAASHLDTFMGMVNTLILLTSSLTMVLAGVSLEKNKRKPASWFLLATLSFGVLFLINKYLEWSAKFSHGLYPNSEILAQHTPGENVFYSLYYLMTGLHGLHILIGVGLLAAMFWMVYRKPRRKVNIPLDDVQELRLTGDLQKSLWNLRPTENEPLHQIQLILFYGQHKGIRDRQMIKIENSGLYWHLVDVVWIFLFPLFYLIT